MRVHRIFTIVLTSTLLSLLVACGSPEPSSDPPSTPSATVTTRPVTKPAATTRSIQLDPRYPTCADAKAAGYGNYRRGVDPEYGWYRDRDQDGWVCES
jgi:micrococcal nuclease